MCDNSLKAVMLMVAVYYKEKIQVKISQGERHIGQRPRGVQTEVFQAFPPVASWPQCVTVRRECCQPGELTGALGSGVFMGAQSQTAMWRIFCPQPFPEAWQISLVISSSEIGTDPTWPETHHKSLC